MSQSESAKPAQQSEPTARRRGLWRRFRWPLVMLISLAAVLIWQRQRIVTPVVQAAVQRSFSRHDPESAQRWVRWGQRLVPDDPQLALMQAQVARKQGDMATAAAALARADSLGAARDRLNREQWLALAQSGQLKDAEPHLAELLTDRRFDNREVCEAFVIGYTRNHRSDAALSLLNPWIDDAPQDATPLVLRARIRQVTGRQPGAEQDYRTAIRRQPDWTVPQIELAELLVRQKQFTEAEPYLTAEAVEKDFPVRSRLALADCRLAQGNSEQALQLLRESCQLDPDSLEAHRACGQVLLETGAGGEAIQKLQRALALRPHDDQSHYLIAQAYSLNQQPEQAQRHFQEVAEARSALAELDRLNTELLTDNDAEKLIRAGQILLNHGDPQEGVVRILAGLDLDPDNLKGLQLLADHYGQLAADDPAYTELAERYRTKLAELSADSPPADSAQ